MESQQKQVIHLYEFKQQSINEKQLSKLILDSLKPYFGNNSPQIKIIGRPHKYWAYFQIEPTIGDNILNIGRYYYDYQIFINQLDPAITRNQVIQYFEQFGEVIDIVITDPAEKKAENFKHCYIKMKQNNVVDQIVLAKIHKIQDKIVKPVRTFGLEEDKESDKKLFLKIEKLDPSPASILEFEEKAIKYFSRHGKLRQRPKVEELRSRIPIAQIKLKMFITYTDSTSAASAIQNFAGSDLYNEYKSINVDLALSYVNTRENKIYVAGLKENSQSVVKEAFQVFGQISQITLNKGKFNNTLSAVIGFTNENDFKMALASYQEYPKISALFTTGKPYVTIFMNMQQKKAFGQMKKKQYQGQNQYVQPSRPVQQAPFYPNPDQFVMNPQMRPMPVGQPGLMQPLMIPPGMNQPGMMQPAMMQPGMMQPGMMPMQPGMMPMNAGMGQKFQKPTPVPPQNN